MLVQVLCDAARVRISVLKFEGDGKLAGLPTVEQFVPCCNPEDFKADLFVLVCQPVGVHGSNACGHYQTVMLLEDLPVRVQCRTEEGLPDHFFIKPAAALLGHGGEWPASIGMPKS